MTSEPGSAAMERIVAGLEHVTRGPWVIGVFRSSPQILHVNGPSDIVVGDDGICQPDRMNDRTFFEDNSNMEHIARCDPDSMRSIAAYIETLTRERDEAREALETGDVNYHIMKPDAGWRLAADFLPAEKLKLRPIAETLAMLDGNAFFGNEFIDGFEWYEQYLPEAHALYEANGGDTGWASESSIARAALAGGKQE